MLVLWMQVGCGMEVLVALVGWRKSKEYGMRAGMVVLVVRCP